jgi:hypothetical protein
MLVPSAANRSCPHRLRSNTFRAVTVSHDNKAARERHVATPRPWASSSLLKKGTGSELTRAKHMGHQRCEVPVPLLQRAVLSPLPQRGRSDAVAAGRGPQPRHRADISDFVAAGSVTSPAAGEVGRGSGREGATAKTPRRHQRFRGGRSCHLSRAAGEVRRGSGREGATAKTPRRHQRFRGDRSCHLSRAVRTAMLS